MSQLKAASLRQWLEPLRSWPLHHLDIDAESGAVAEDAGLVSAIGPDLGHAGMDRGQVGEQELAAGGVVHIGGWFGDVKDRKKVYMCPVTVFEDSPRGPVRVRPDHTVDNSLSVNAVDAAGSRWPADAIRHGTTARARDTGSRCPALSSA
ncbi:hypothetical protein ACWER6_27680 [Streptomyces sp. NPDC004009]